LAVYQPPACPALTAATLAAPGRVRFVDVNGARAAYTADPTGVGFLEWQTTRASVSFSSRSAEPADLTALARRLQPVAGDDPRLAGVRDGADSPFLTIPASRRRPHRGYRRAPDNTGQR